MATEFNDFLSKYDKIAQNIDKMFTLEYPEALFVLQPPTPPSEYRHVENQDRNQ